MHGTPDAGSAGEAPLDWPAPDAPLPGEEPTIEIPIVDAGSPAGPTSTPTLAAAALALALTHSTTELAALGRAARPDEEWFPFDQFDLGPAGTGPDEEQPEARRLPALRRDRRVPALERRGPRQPPPQSTVEAAPEVRPAATPAASTPDSPAGAEPGRRRLVGAGLVAAALLLVGATVVVLGRDGEPSDASAVGLAPPVVATSAAGRPAHVATGALGGRTEAGFDLVDGAEQVTVRAADLGDVLYRVTTPAGGDGVPRAEEQPGRVRLRLDGKTQAVDIALNAAVRWDLRVTGGAGLSTIDLSAGRVGGVDLGGGAGRIDLTLPRPDGTLTVRMTGGVSLFAVRTADRAPVRVRVGSGAGQVTLNGQNHAGVAAGQTFTPAAWAGAVDRIDVDAAAGMSSLTVAPY